jgi:hypothetical protein
MYGLQAVYLAPETPDRGSRLMHVGNGRGGRRQMTEDSRVYISAVAVLNEEQGSSQPFLYTYHNYFARIPLPIEVFRGPLDRHYRKPAHPDECPQAWEEVHMAGAAK